MKSGTGRFTIAIILLLLTCLNAAGADYYGPDSDRFNSASDCVADGRYPEAIGIYTALAAESMEPANSVRALFFSASVYDHYLDQYETALEIYRKIYSGHPESVTAPDALFNSGRLLCRIGRFREAAARFAEFTRLYPDNMRRRSAEIWAERALTGAGQTAVSVPPELSGKTDPEIRVLLKKKARRLVFNAPEKIRITHLSTGKALYCGDGPVVITKKGDKIAVNTEKTSASACMIESSHYFISTDGERFRGKFVIYTDPGGLTLVNHIHIEKYLYGVVPKEMSWLWSAEALKAQAIASRTYAIYIREKQKSGKRYDLTATTASQVYGGFSAEKEETDRAVDETAGLIIHHGKKPVIAYFHANSGGMTESSGNVWGAKIPYLKSVPDPYSSIPEKERWSYAVSWKNLTERLKSVAVKTGRIKSVKPEQITESGRIKSFLITGSKGSARIKANIFRMRVGATNMKSTCFKISPGHFRVRFDGTGYGHGVGMSQWGAHQMGLAGKSANEILRHYYQNVQIVKAGYL